MTLRTLPQRREIQKFAMLTILIADQIWLLILTSIVVLSGAKVGGDIDSYLNIGSIGVSIPTAMRYK